MAQAHFLQPFLLAPAFLYSRHCFQCLEVKQTQATAKDTFTNYNSLKIIKHEKGALIIDKTSAKLSAAIFIFRLNPISTV